MKLNYVLIPAVTILVAAVGGWLTEAGPGSWYRTIKLPSWTPSGSVIGLVWSVIFLLTAIAALIIWNAAGSKPRLDLIVGLFLANAGLNVLWSLLFFRLHLLTAAGWEAALLDLTVLGLIVLCWPIARSAAWLLMPYAGWVAFATYLTFLIGRLNR